MEEVDLNDTIVDTDNEGPGPKAPRVDNGQQVTYVMTAEQIQQLLQRSSQQEPMMGEEAKEFFRAQTNAIVKGSEEKVKAKCVEEAFKLTDELVHITDNGRDIVDVRARMLLSRNPNCAPDTWWKPGCGVPQISKPRLSHSLQFGYLTGSYMCRESVFKAHDRGEFLQLKHFAAKNSGIVAKIQKQMQIGTDVTGEIVGALDKDFKEISSISEAKEAVRNLVTITWAIRAYDYGPLVMANVLERVHYFSGPSKGDKGIQKALIIKYCDTMMTKNATQGVNGEHPLIYKDALTEARSTCQSMSCDDSFILLEHQPRGGGGQGRENNKGGMPGITPIRGNLNGNPSSLGGFGNSSGRGRGRRGGGANLNQMEEGAGNLNPNSGKRSAYATRETFKVKYK